MNRYLFADCVFFMVFSIAMLGNWVREDYVGVAAAALLIGYIILDSHWFNDNYFWKLENN